MSPWMIAGATVDVVHALLMVAWLVGLPLLFYRRWPRLTRAYAIYALAFIVLYQVSDIALGECFLTTVARSFWQRAPADLMGGASQEWFTVRLVQKVFDMTPSYRSITLTAQALVVLTALGALYALSPWGRRLRQRLAAVEVKSEARDRRAPPTTNRPVWPRSAE